MFKDNSPIVGLLQKIDSLNQKIRKLKNPDLWPTIEQKLRIEWTYNSNAIEGNTLTLGETAFFLREGLTAEGKPLKDYLEAKNHAEAIDGLEDVVKNKRSITEGLIKELHGVLMKDMEYTYARGAGGQMIKKPLTPGQYKTRPNHVLTLSGKIHHYTDPLHVKDEMEKLVHWLNQVKSMHPFELAALFHYRFVTIHPFDDGNGRLARILMNLMLMKNGYPPCIIRNVRRRQYIGALEEADQKQEMFYFICFVAEEFLVTLQTIVDALEGTKETEIEKAPKKLNKTEWESLILETISGGEKNIGQLMEAYPNIPRPTLKQYLKNLVGEGKIQKRGITKGVIYFLT